MESDDSDGGGDDIFTTRPSGSATVLPRLFDDGGSATEESGESTDDGMEYRYLDDFQPKEPLIFEEEEGDLEEQEGEDEGRSKKEINIDSSQEDEGDEEDRRQRQRATLTESESKDSHLQKNPATQSSIAARRGRQRSRSKEKLRGRSLSKSKKKKTSAKSSKKKTKLKRRRGKMKKRKRSKSRKQKRPFDEIAYRAAKMWTFLEKSTKTAPITTITTTTTTGNNNSSININAINSEEKKNETTSKTHAFRRVEMQYMPGPIGVTFAWNNSLIVMAVPGATILTNSLSADTDTKCSALQPTKYPNIGARLSSVNGISVLGKTFKETVTLLEDSQNIKRSLTFDQFVNLKKLKKKKNSSSSISSSSSSSSSSSNSNEKLKLPTISRPSSTSGLKKVGNQQRDTNRPSSAGGIIENPEEHDALIEATANSRRQGAWQSSSNGEETSLVTASTSLTPSTKEKKKKKKKKKIKNNETKEETDPYHGPIQKLLEKVLMKSFNSVSEKSSLFNGD
jgi:hypothetical protein